MKRFYVTKKQVDEYIATRLRVFKISEDVLLCEVDKELLDFKEYPNLNKYQIRFFTKVREELNRIINIRNNRDITYYRNPTQSEIKFGEGAIHYKSFEFKDCLNSKGEIKKWVICPIDGLRYYR